MYSVLGINFKNIFMFFILKSLVFNHNQLKFLTHCRASILGVHTSYDSIKNELAWSFFGGAASGRGVIPTLRCGTRF